MLALLAVGLVAACGHSGGSDTDGDGEGPALEPVLPDFSLRTDVRIGAGFLSDALALDLNGDGLVDLVEGNFPQATVTIAFGNPDGTFTTVYTLPTLGAPWRLAAGDVDGNGLLDLSVTCLDDRGSYPLGVQVFLHGPLLGDFGTSITKSVATRPLDVALAPVAGTVGPGPQELFVADRQAGAVLRFVFDGLQLVENGSLDTASLGTGRPISVATLDIGGDGWVDLVVGEVDVAGGEPDRVVVFPRGPTGFGAPIVLLSPLFSPVVDNAGDVDGNTYDDLSIAQLTGNEGFLLAGDGSGLYQLHGFDFEGTTSSLVFGDVNGDGLADAAGTVLESDTVNVRLGTGPLAWGEPVRYNVGFLPRALGLVALPGDELPDLVCATSDDFSLLVNRGDGTFRGAVGYPIADGPVHAEAADLDGDGDLDVVAVTERQTAVCFLENVGGGRLELATTVPLVASGDENFGYLAVADMNGDGLLDVVASIYQADQVWIFRNTGSVAGFALPAPFDVYDVGVRPIGLGVGDLDADGMTDLVVGLAGSNQVRCLMGVGNAELQLAEALAVPNRPGVVRVADLDGNGSQDVVLTTGGGGTSPTLVVLEGDGTGTLAPAFQADLDTLGSSLGLADFDGDDLLDVVVAQPGVAWTDVFVARNQGGLAFDVQPLTIGPNPANVLAFDVDRDGNQDVVVASGTGDLRWALGDGTGGFPVVEPEPGTLPVPHATVASLAVDLDGDGYEDLLLVSPLSPLVWTARNTSVLLPLN